MMSQQRRFKRHKGGVIGPTLRPHEDPLPLPSAAAAADAAAPRYLPHDLFANILHRLRVKPLIRFKCVSKSWRDLISNPDFVQLHLAHAKSESDRNSDLMSMSVVASDKRHLRSSLHLIPINRFDSTPRKICSGDGHWWYAVGSWDGLVCFRIADKYLVFCNPWTGDQVVEALPEISLVAEETVSSYAFGYDDGCHDYKVVRLIEKYNVECDMNMCEVQVYCLRANVWKKNRIIEIDNKGPPPHKQNRRMWRFVPKEGAIYWWSVSIMFWIKGAEKVIRYDIERDQWSTILMPLYEHGHQVTKGVAVVNDCLCLLVCNIVEKTRNARGKRLEVTEHMEFDFWTLAHETSTGEPTTWNLMFSVSEKTQCSWNQLLHSDQLVGFLRDGEKFLFKFMDEALRFFWFDLSQKITNADCHGNHFTNDYIDPVICVETLVSPF